MRVLLIPAVAATIFATAASGAETPDATLAVCADPGNLPYSSNKLDGFENKVAELLAADMHRSLRYAWAPQRRNFFSRTLLAHACDVVISVPSSLPLSLPTITTTRPWFVSTYVAVTRTADNWHFTSFDDPWLKSARIGLQMIDGGDVNPPPAMALSRRGITNNIMGFSPWDTAQDAPQSRLVDAVAHNTIDVALIWGPFGGYFAQPYGDALKLEPITSDPATPGLSFIFPMAAAVRSDDIALKDALQLSLDRNTAKIATILKGFSIPTVEPPAKTEASDPQISEHSQ